MGTVLAQSRLVAILDRQRSSTEGLMAGLRAEVESLRDQYRQSQEELLQWKTRALRGREGMNENSKENDLLKEGDDKLSKMEVEDEEGVRKDRRRNAAGLLREVANDEMESYLLRTSASFSSHSSFPNHRNYPHNQQQERQQQCVGVSGMKSSSSLLPVDNPSSSTVRRHPRRSPEHASVSFTLSETLARDLQRTQATLDALSQRSKLNLRLLDGRGMSVSSSNYSNQSRHVNNSVNPYRVVTPSLAQPSSSLYASKAPPAMASSSSFASLYPQSKARPPKSDELREWFRSNSVRGY